MTDLFTFLFNKDNKIKNKNIFDINKIIYYIGKKTLSVLLISPILFLIYKTPDIYNSNNYYYIRDTYLIIVIYYIVNRFSKRINLTDKKLIYNKTVTNYIYKQIITFVITVFSLFFLHLIENQTGLIHSYITYFLTLLTGIYAINRLLWK